MPEKIPEVHMGTVRSRTDITPEGKFEEYYEVEFYVDDARFTFKMSPEGWTAKKAEELVKKRAAELVAVKDKKVIL